MESSSLIPLKVNTPGAAPMDDSEEGNCGAVTTATTNDWLLTPRRSL